MERIYLDHTATTPVDDRVRDAMLPYFSGIFGNASSVHSYGREAKRALEQSREIIAGTIGAKPGEVFFTSGGTEANNLALRGAAQAARDNAGRNHLITSLAEHHAILEPCELLRKGGFEVTILPVDTFALVSPEAIDSAVGPGTFLVSIMAGNNEVGSLSPLESIGTTCRTRGILFHSDAVQALGKIPLDVNSLNIDLLSLSAHKIYGPKGIGALYIRQVTALDPVVKGGGQERGKRPGTESVALAVGFARALELAHSEMKAESMRLGALRDQLEAIIRSKFPEAIVNGHPRERLPGILSVSFDSNRIKLEGEMLVVNMDLEGIAVASGSACTSGSVQPSHVILATGRDQATARATVRFSFGRSNTPEHCKSAADALERVIARMKQ